MVIHVCVYYLCHVAPLHICLQLEFNKLIDLLIIVLIYRYYIVYFIILL